MDALSFLYIALGVGFLLLVIFLCASLIYVIQILRDVGKITDRVNDTTERINDYLVQPFAFLSNAAEHIRPILETVLNKRDELNAVINQKVHKAASKFKKKMKEMDEE